MIQPATQSSASNLLLGTGLLSAETEESAGAGDFAALLLSTGVIAGEVETTETSADPMAAFSALRQEAGKPAGKSLPAALPQAEAGNDTTTAEGEAKADSRPAGDEAPSDAAAPEPVLSLAMLTAALMPQAVTGRTTQAPVAPEAPATALPQVKGPQAIRPHLAETEAASPTTMIIGAARAPLPVPVSTPAATATITMPFVVPAAETAAAQAAPVQSTETAITERAAEPALRATADISTTANTPRTTPRPTAARAAKPGTATIAAANPQPAPLDAAVAQAPATTLTPVVAERVSAAPRPTTGDAAPVAEKARATASDTASARLTAAAPTAAELQPVIALREAQPTVQTGPVDAPRQTQGHLAPHDFAALVDRLVEARDASAPHIVSTAVSHVEFGRIALRFEQNDNGLTVAMNSTDPEFARAVQAAQPAAQVQAGSDNGQSAPRHESAQQHSATGTQPQAQGQAQGQASARGGQNDQGSQSGEARRAAREQTQDHADDDTAPRRGGIYA